MITIRERKSDTLHCFYQAIEIRADNGRVYAKGSKEHWKRLEEAQKKRYKEE